MCTNGILTLDYDYTAFTPNAFPLSTGVPIIAPFWADSDLRLGGDLWSREVTSDLDILNNGSYYDKLCLPICSSEYNKSTKKLESSFHQEVHCINELIILLID